MENAQTAWVRVVAVYGSLVTCFYLKMNNSVLYIFLVSGAIKISMLLPHGNIIGSHCRFCIFNFLKYALSNNILLML